MSQKQRTINVKAISFFVSPISWCGLMVHIYMVKSVSLIPVMRCYLLVVIHVFSFWPLHRYIHLQYMFDSCNVWWMLLWSYQLWLPGICSVVFRDIYISSWCPSSNFFCINWRSHYSNNIYCCVIFCWSSSWIWIFN